jgi:hypothetical protein
MIKNINLEVEVTEDSMLEETFSLMKKSLKILIQIGM